MGPLCPWQYLPSCYTPCSLINVLFSRRLGSGLCSKVQEDLINFFSMIVIVALVSIDSFRGYLLPWFQFFGYRLHNLGPQNLNQKHCQEITYDLGSGAKTSYRILLFSWKYLSLSILFLIISFYRLQSMCQTVNPSIRQSLSNMSALIFPFIKENLFPLLYSITR